MYLDVMNMIADNKMYIGIITDFADYDNATVIFTIPNLIEEGKAYSMMTEKKPAIGDEIILFKMSSQLNAFWYYLKVDQTGEFILEYNGANFIFKDGKLYIQADNINFGNKVSETETQEGTESFVYGTKLASWLRELISILSTKYKVLTSVGPSSTATPDALVELQKLGSNIDKLISDYMKAVDDKGNLTI